MNCTANSFPNEHETECFDLTEVPLIVGVERKARMKQRWKELFEAEKKLVQLRY